MPLAPELLEILACPEDKGPLYYIEAEDVLYNPRLRRTYEIRDDIPVMLIDEATPVAADENDRLLVVVSEAGITPTFDDDGGAR